MEKDSSEDEMGSSIHSGDSEKDKSFVTKVRSRMSGLFNSSITRLFGNQEKLGSMVRRRESDHFCENQPPRKRVKHSENSFLQNSNIVNHIAHETSNLDGPSNLSSGVFTNFVEPIAGTSGLKPQVNWNKKFNTTLSTPSDLSNDKDSESGESTSGYSSMSKLGNRQPQQNAAGIGNRDVSALEEKKSSGSKTLFEMSSTPVTPDRSLFSDRSLFADRSVSPQAKNTSLSSRRPSFNASSFGSPNFVDRTITTSRIINSPFYNGPTTFGGASAYDNRSVFNESRKQQLRNSFLVKPINRNIQNNSSTSLSKTARRILDTLEQYSSSMSDVKKSISPTKKKTEGLLSKYLGANPYNVRQSKGSSNKELLVPTTPDLLRMKQRQQLQNTTDNIRKIASSNSSLNTEHYKIREENQQKYTNKMKTKITSVRGKTATVEILEDVILNPVPLAIPENKLPKFDLVIPPPEAPKKINNEVEESQKCNKNKSAVVEIFSQKRICTKAEDFTSEFIFSNPLVIADNLKSIVAINNFKFSEPVCRKVVISEKENTTAHNISKKTDNKINNGDITRNVVAQNVIECLKYKKSDPLMEKFKAPEGSWECSTCLIQNKANAIKCIACETLRLKETSKAEQTTNLPGFGIQFNLKSDEWECTSCLIRNKVSSLKCIACGVVRPSTNITKTNGFGDQFRMSVNEWECQTCLVRNKIDLSKCAACETTRNLPKSSFGDKFKPPSDSWECQTCLIRNKGDVGKCIACETERSKSIKKVDFGPQFKTSDTWKCDTCLIRNKHELTSCAACQTPKDKIISIKSNETLKKSTEKWECPTCLVRNNNDVEKCPCCETTKPGCTSTKRNDVSMFNFGVSKSQFNFGIPKEEKNENKKTDNVKSGTNLVDSTSASGFNFGIKPVIKETSKGETTANILPESKANVEAVKSPKFSFGIPSIPKVCELKENKQSTGFNFKAPTTAEESNKLPCFSSATTNLNIGTSPSTTSTITLNSPSEPLIKFDTAKPLVTPAQNITAPVTASLTSQGNQPAFNTGKSEVFAFRNSNAAPSFSFGKTENSSSSAAPTKPVFTFGSTSTTPDSKGFNFVPTTSLKTNSGGQTATGFAFNPPKSESNVFPTSGTSPKNGGFNFGNPAMNNNQAAVFSFGATQNLPQTLSNTAQPTMKGFNFAAPAAPSTGFSLSAPTFDSNVKPSFNFTGGNIPTFAATPTDGGGAAPVRKFKKAVRRAAQR